MERSGKEIKERKKESWNSKESRKERRNSIMKKLGKTGRKLEGKLEVS